MASLIEYRPPRLTSCSVASGTSLIQPAISAEKPRFRDWSTSLSEKRWKASLTEPSEAPPVRLLPRYLAKEATTSREAFAVMYPELNSFREIKNRVDPNQRFVSAQARRLEIV